MNKVGYIQKKKSEIQFDKVLTKVVSQINSFPTEKSAIEKWKVQSYELLENFISEEDIIKMSSFDINFKDGFIDSTKKFIKMARIFDNKQSIEDIGQAMRNVWIVNILQALFGKTVQFTEAIFSYSMLYPYTDNFLDNPNKSKEEKVNFNTRLEKRLRGEVLVPKDDFEEKVFTLVGNIEEVYNRSDYVEVYESLLEIHKGQIKSLLQQDEITVPYDRDILGISILKGGSSVLVDGYLTSGNLSSDEIHFCIGYGIILQIADDLQDAEEDLKNNHMTIISQVADKYLLDTLCSKLINFTVDLVDEFNFNKANIVEMDKPKKLIKVNCINLILFSVVFSKNYFSPEYIKQIEPYLPFTLGYIEKLKGKINDKFSTIVNKDNAHIMNIIENMVD